ncbi:MAG: helix-turn-helix transcriptional regulator [Thermoanaerobaculaceae bacterium]
MKNERLFAIVNHLLTRGRTGARELAARFEVSERTIYRDMDSLSGSGVPVVAVAGAGGGFEIEEGFRIDRSFLTGEELADLTVTVGAFTEALGSRRLERSLEKLEGLGARPRRTPQGRSAAPVDGGTGSGNPSSAPAPPLVVTLTPWGGRSADSGMVELLREAVTARHPVALVYRDLRGAVTERVVEPFTMVLGGAVWYLHAFCRLRATFRLFRVSRIIEARPLGEVFDPWLRAPVPEPFVWSSVEPVVDVELEVAPARVAALAETFDRATVTMRRDGSARVAFRSPAGEWLETYLLSLGPGVRVVAPSGLRDAVRAAALAVAESNRQT